ncbi:MAG: hypothetical protein U0Y96_16720 [Candidatus Kapaibacterium sp.]
MKHLYNFLLLLCVAVLPLMAQPDNGWRPLGKQGMLGAHVLGFTQAKGGDMMLLSRQTVYRSTNMGGQWFVSNKGLPYGKDSVYCITSNKNGDVFIGTGDGVYRSIDTGNTWQRVSNGIAKIKVHTIFPDTNGVLLAGANGLIFRSTDNGDSWTEVGLEIPAEYKKGVPQFVYSYKDGIKVSFGSWYYASLTLGATWKNISIGIDPDTYYKRFIAYDVKSTMEAKVFFDNEWIVRLNRKSDGLSTGCNLGLTFSFVYHRFACQIFPYTDDGFYQGFAFVSKDSVLMGSYDHGIHKIALCNFCSNDSNNATGRFVNYGLKNLSITSLYKSSNGRIFCGTRGGGAYYSTNNGESWVESVSGLYEPSIYNMLLPKKGESTYYSATATGVYISTDSANTWNRRVNGLENVYVISLMLSRKGVLFAGTQNGMYRSVDNGIQWKFIATPSVKTDLVSATTSIAISDIKELKDGSLICSTVGGLLFASKDDGKSWTQTAAIVLDHERYKNQIMELAYDSINGNIHVAAVRYILSTSDNGKTFTDYFTGGYMSSIALSTNRKTLFCGGFNNLVSKNTSITSTDLSTITGDLSRNVFPDYTINSVKTDPLNNLMLATLGKGAYFSDNNGLNWKLCNKGLPDGDLLNFVQDDKYYLYACTANNGIYISEKPTAMLQAPVLVTPKHDSTDAVTDITFTWKPVLNAQKYQLQISKDSSFASPAFDVQQLVTTNKAVTLQSGVTYYWRVRGTSDGLIGDWSEIRTLSTLAILPEKPLLKTPVNDSILPTSTVQFEWMQSKRTDTYTIQYSTDSLFTNSKSEIAGVTILSQSSTSLQPNTTYYWRVQGVNTIGVGEWSDVWKFTTGHSTDVADNEDSRFITISPIPTSDALVINGIGDVINGIGDEDITVKLYDTQGKLYLVSSGTKVNTKGLASGVYNCIIIIKNKLIQKQIVITR